MFRVAPLGQNLLLPLIPSLAPGAASALATGTPTSVIVAGRLRVLATALRVCPVLYCHVLTLFIDRCHSFVISTAVRTVLPPPASVTRPCLHADGEDHAGLRREERDLNL